MSILNFIIHQLRVIFAPNSVMRSVKVETKEEQSQ